MDAIADLVQNLPAGFFVGLIVALILGTFLFRRYRHHRAEGAVDELVAREPGWDRTRDPVGLREVGLGGAYPPLGTDRRGGVRYAITGPLTVEVAGRPVECRASCFRWWYEQRSSGSDGGTSRHDLPVGIVRLPVPVPTRISIRREDLVSRMGMTHGGEQFESEEFNRRFRVETEDPTLAARLLDTNLQEQLLDRFQGRRIELAHDFMLVAGDPDHRDDSLPKLVGELPAVREDLQDLVRHVPAAFWASLEADPGDADGPEAAR